MRSVARAALIPICALLCLACVPDFEPASRLGESPQVLAVRAEPASVAPGETVRLDALVHWPKAGPEQLWLVCIPTAADAMDTCVANRLAGGGVLLPLCASAPGAPLCYASRDATALYTVPADLPLNEDGEATIFLELVVGDDIQSDDCVRAYRDLDPGERCQVALKRLSVTTGSPNLNPALLALEVDGHEVDATDITALDPSGGQGDELAVTLAVRVVSRSVDELVGTEAPDEVLFPVAWYSDCGKIVEDTDNLVCVGASAPAEEPLCDRVEATWKPASSGACTVHVTVRDGRGGVAWLTRQFVVGEGG